MISRHAFSNGSPESTWTHNALAADVPLTGSQRFVGKQEVIQTVSDVSTGDNRLSNAHWPESAAKLQNQAGSFVRSEFLSSDNSCGRVFRICMLFGRTTGDRLAQDHRSYRIPVAED